MHKALDFSEGSKSALGSFDELVVSDSDALLHF